MNNKFILKSSGWLMVVAPHFLLAIKSKMENILSNQPPTPHTTCQKRGAEGKGACKDGGECLKPKSGGARTLLGWFSFLKS